MTSLVPEVLYSEKAILERVDEMAERISPTMRGWMRSAS